MLNTAVQDSKAGPKVQVAVVTTAGSFPSEGYEPEPIHQKVEQLLKKAAKQLGIIDTSRWIAKVSGREVDPAKSYEENDLSGQFEIDWGPREGGGGAR